MKTFGLLAALAVLAASSSQAQVNGVTAELLLDQNQFISCEDVPLNVRVLNRSGQEITLGTDNDWIAVTITGENNAPCAKLGNMPVRGEFSLQSGEMGTRTLNPAPYFDFQQPGRYRVSARIRLAQWQQEIGCKPVYFNVGSGVALPNLANLQIGLPPAPGAANGAPEVRRYSLLKVSYVKEIKLYFRLTDSAGKILRVFPLTRMTSFTDPEAQIDRYNNLHVLSQNGARSFAYCVLNPEGQWVTRQTYMYSDTRPILRLDTEGKIFVANGARRISADDFPPPAPESARQ